MSKIFKICLIIAIFLSSASVAWAGFNYDSLLNHYLIDSILKLDGDYLILGDVIPATGTMQTSAGSTNAFLLMSGNLVFLGDGPLDAGANRKLGINAGQAYLATNAITINNNNPFVIATSSGPLTLQTGTVKMNGNFKLLNKNGLSFLNPNQQPINTITPETIFTPKILTNTVQTITADRLLIKEGVTLTINANSTTFDAEAGKILMGGEHFCKLISWSVANMADNDTADKTTRGDAWAANTGDQTNRTQCPADGGEAFPTYTTGGIASKVCCPKDYFVFDLRAKTADNKARMACCRAAKGPFQ